ncbi:conserved hypothetical protein [Vibrio coralliirubri]|nr:conserved hypothetical protein [Vibrio coralliirubri]
MMTNEKNEMTTTKRGNSPDTPASKARTPTAKDNIDTNAYSLDLLT